MDRDTIEQCTVPPKGWICQRGKGHVGPCAANPLPDGQTEAEYWYARWWDAMEDTRTLPPVDELVEMTLHEHFAGLAMQGIVSSIDSEENYQRLKNLAQIDGLSVSEWIARDAHKQADAMLAVNSDTDAQAYLGEK